MMLTKLSLKNIKKSIKDYSIYFFTLVVAVAIFYIFNSLDAQESVMVMSESKHQLICVIMQILGYVSIFISVVLGFLIIYTNNFLIKRRKKEFGLYLTLGMPKRKVSAVLVIETMLVGFVSLGIGLVLGIFASQFLSIVTANLFEANMESFVFIFSQAALIKTLIYFGIIFVLVMLFNVISINKYKLIDLLNASKKNEKIKIKSKFSILIVFFLAIALLMYAYDKLFSGVLLEFNIEILYMLITGALGTLLLFFSFSGFFLKMVQLNKKMYYKNLNMFVLKQVNNKANTTVFSTTIICLMLLLTIGILAGSISLITAVNSSINDCNRMDISIAKSINNGPDKKNTEKLVDVSDIAKRDYIKDYLKEYVVYNVYDNQNVLQSDLLDVQAIIEAFGQNANFGTSFDIMMESDYNKIMDMYGLSDKKVDLTPNEYILTADIDAYSKYYEKAYSEEKKAITLGDNYLLPATDKLVKMSFKNSAGMSNGGTLIVDDSLVQYLNAYQGVLIANYINTDDKEKIEEAFIDKIRSESLGAYSYSTKLEMQEANVTTKAIVIFVGMYIGIVLAISSANILAIGQLSESSDNKDRYKVLRQLGADKKMINKALFIQIAVAFVIPLVVAIFHAYFGLSELNGIIEFFGNIDLTQSILLTAIAIIIMYGGYFVATYLCSKNIIKE